MNVYYLSRDLALGTRDNKARPAVSAEIRDSGAQCRRMEYCMQCNEYGGGSICGGWSTPAANVSALRIHRILKVARSKPSVDCGWPSYNSYVFWAYKSVHIFAGGFYHSLSYNPSTLLRDILSSHIQQQQ